MSTVIKDKAETDPDEEARLERIKNKPDVTECFNLLDFEVQPFPLKRPHILTIGRGKTSHEENSLGILFIRSR